MNTFLSHTVATIYQRYGSFDSIVFVVPSIRAGIHLKTSLSQHITKPILSPEIYGIEGFINIISQLQPVNNTELLFALYEVYQQSVLAHKDDFYAFARWASTLLSDFDELDRYLIDAKELFNQITEVKKVDSWNLDGPPSEMVRNYISFNQQLATLHSSLAALLFENHTGYQGLRYRVATANLQHYLNKTKTKKHIFLGFNALNNAESNIIQNILSSTDSHIFWDLDSYFLSDPMHSAGHFIRSYLKQWPYYKQHQANSFPSTYLSKEKIQITGIPKNITQTKYVGNLLKELYSTGNTKTIALVLADESLLPAMLNAIPEEVGEVNITMGFPLEKTVISDFFNVLLDFYLLQSSRGWPAKEVLKVLSHPISKSLLNTTDASLQMDLKDQIIAHSYGYITAKQLESWIPKTSILRFMEFPPKSSSFLEIGTAVLKHLTGLLKQPSELIELEAIHLYHSIFNQLNLFLQKQVYLQDLKNLKSILSELVTLETISFKGSPVKGLQIMGMLETRALDFETVIITSVNEGILPAGKSNNSFVPYDLKRAFKMPTFRDKDAIYTYHFYRLLQRAKNVYITYNTEPDVLEGGERSRFIPQLLADNNLKPFLIHTIGVPKVSMTSVKAKQIAKTPKLIQQLHRLASSGFSPTSLTTYIKNPYTFYKQYVLGIKEVSNLSESIAPNTFGTIIHDTLEALYTPMVGIPLSPKVLESLKPRIEQIAKAQFSKALDNQRLDKGQLLIVFNVILKYVRSVVDHDIAQAKNHEIQILALEQKLHIAFQVSGLDQPVHLKGTIDRIETIDGVNRIIDYKTGQALKSDVTLVDYQDLLEKETKSKAFQLLSYALMYHSTHANTASLKAGILPIKSITNGVLEFGIKTSPQARTKDALITQQTLHNFSVVLEQLVQEILNPNIPFIDIENELF